MNPRGKTNTLFFTFLALLLAPAGVFAADTPLNEAATAWILTATALVLFMTIPGLAMFYAGLVRSKNVLSVLMQCFAITCLVSVVWIVAGYSLAFGNGGVLNGFIGSLEYSFLWGVNVNAVHSTGVPLTLFMMFQMTFAIITPALIIGGFAERMKFTAMLWFSLLWLLLVYIPVCHWVWGGGWLSADGLKLWDFAGGTVVHINAGVAALLCAVIVGRRHGFPETAMPPHNLTMTVAGAAMLWVGWFGFNAGSAVAANGSAAMAMLVTHLGAASGSLAWMFMEWKRFGKPSVLGIVTGMVAGLGTITPASGYVGPVGALIIGTVAGFICFTATQYVKKVLKIDDSLDVFPVHGVGGIVGTLMAALGTVLDGLYVHQIEFWSQLGIQAVGVLAVGVWCAVLTILILKILDNTIGLRVAKDEETEGLDIVMHEEKGYNL